MSFICGDCRQEHKVPKPEEDEAGMPCIRALVRERDALVLQIEDGKKKYSDLLQSHYSLSGQVTMANEIIATVQINKDEIDLKDRVAQLVERFRKGLKDSDEQLRLNGERLRLIHNVKHAYCQQACNLRLNEHTAFCIEVGNYILKPEVKRNHEEKA